MSDIRSRIVFESTGGDKVAQDIGKIKKSFEDASSAKDSFARAGTDAGGLPSDAFGRATRQIQFPIGSTPGTRGENAGIYNGMQDRDARHRQTFSQQALGGVQRGVSAVTQAGSGDVVGGGGTLMMGMSKLGVAGIVAASVAAVGIGIAKLADKDLERSTKLFTNLGQQLGYKKSDIFNEQVTALEKKGYMDTIPFLTAMAGAGAGMGDVSEIDKAMATQLATGADMGGLGTLFGQMRLTRASTSNARQENIAMQGVNAFGKAGMTEFYALLSQAMETGMTKGFEKGSPYFRNMYTTMVQGVADLGLAGMTVKGAGAMYQGLTSAVMGSAGGLRSPEDVYRFMRARTPGETFGATIRAMSSPENIKQTYKNLKADAGGNYEALEQMLVSTFPGVVDYNNVQTFINSQEMRLYKDAHPTSFGGDTRTDVLGMDTGLLQRRADYQLKQSASRAVAGLGGDAQSAVMNWFRGITLSEEERDSLRANQAIINQPQFQNRARAGAGFGFANGAGAETYIQSFPANMQTWVRGVLQNEDEDIGDTYKADTFIMSQLMPMMSGYGEWKKDPYSKNISEMEKLRYKKYQGMFEEVSGMIGGADPEAFSSGANLKAFEDRLIGANVENIDSSTVMLSILEALRALVDMGLGEGVSDEWMSETDQ